MKGIVLLLVLVYSSAFAQSHEQLAREYHATVFAIQRQEILEDSTKAAVARQPELAPYSAVYRGWLAGILDSKEYEERMVKTYMELVSPNELAFLIENSGLGAYRQYMVSQPLIERIKLERTVALTRSHHRELLERLKQAGYFPFAR